MLGSSDTRVNETATGPGRTRHHRHDRRQCGGRPV